MTPLTQPRALIRLFFTILLTVSSCFGLSSDDIFGQRFEDLYSRFKSSSPPGKVVLLDQMYRLREYLNDADSVGSVINRVASDRSQPMLVREEANWHRAQIAMHERRLGDAANIIEGLGFIREWRLASTNNCKATKLGTSSVSKSSPLGTVSIYNKNASLCAVVAIYSSSKKNVAIRFGSNVATTVYLNGARAKSSGQSDFAGFDQHSVGVSLSQGWNTIALELNGKESVKQFSMRLTNPDGGGLSFDTDSSHVGAIKIPFINRVFVADLFSMAEQNVAAKSLESLDTLAALSRLRGLRSNFKQMESLAQSNPTPERWIAVAQGCPNQSCKVTALKNAIQSNAKNVAAKTALAEQYLDHKQTDEAQHLLADALALNPSDFTVRKRLADVYELMGNHELASAEFKKLEAIHSNSIWLRRELALHYENVGRTGDASALLNQVWKSDFDDAKVRNALERLAAQRQDFIALQMLAQAANIVDPADPVAKLDIAKYTPAISENTKTGTIAPVAIDNSPTKENAGRLVRAAHRDIIADKPSAKSAASVEDTEYFVDAAQLAADVHKQVPQENANVVVLSDATVERLLDNGQSVIHAQQVFYMANDRGARDYSTRSVQFSSATQKLTAVIGRIYKADGRVVEAEDQGETGVTDNSNSMYFDTRTHTLRFPGLERGDVMELEYRIVPNSTVNPYGNYFGALITFQTGLPQRLHRYVFVAPSDRTLNIDEERMPSKSEVTHAGDQTIYQWDTTDLKPLVIEPRGPSHTEVAPYVSISTFRNWDDFGKWYADMLAPQLTLDSDLRAELDRIIAGSKSERETVQAIYEFVIRNTNYVAMEFGVYSYKPYPVTQVYARRFGDCKDKASLMIAMLREAGIDAELALIRTRKLGSVSERAMALSIFNHAIVYIPKYDLWLDGTAEYAGSRELPLDDQGAMALTVNLSGKATLRRVSGTLPMQNYTHRVVHAKIESDGKVVFSGSVYTRGEDAPGLRREYELAARQIDTVRANLAQVYPSVKVEAVHVEGAHDIEHDVNVNFSGSLDTFKGHTAFSLEPSWLPHRYVNSLAPAQSRSQELQLPAPWTTEEELHFSIPGDANFEALPKNLRYETPFGTAVIRYEHRGRELTVMTSVQFRKLRISPGEYASFREFCESVERAFHQEIKVRLAG